MEFMNRGMRSAQPTSPASTATHTPGPAHHGSRFDRTRGMRIFSVALIFSVTILLLALAASLFMGGGSGESRFVDKTKFQAVFLNGGQVYFGRVTSLNDRFVRVNDIYYLRVTQQVQPDTGSSQQNNVSLVKLGCELHGPTDEMVINREQVIFWENLKDDGQVAKAVSEYKKQNPDGQKCNTPAQTTPSSTNQ